MWFKCIQINWGCLASEAKAEETSGAKAEEKTKVEGDSPEDLPIKEKLKKPKEYGGWSKWIFAWILFPIVGLIIGIVGMAGDNEIKKAQGKSLVICSIILIILGLII